METQETQTKRCPKCGEVKPVTEFAINRSNKDGLQNYCRSCNNKLYKDWAERKRQEKLEAELDPKVEERDRLKKHANPLISVSTEDLVKELKGRGFCIMINPTPRELMGKLKEAGYTVTLEVMVKKTVSLSALEG